jgi:hypothetical protein
MFDRPAHAGYPDDGAPTAQLSIPPRLVDLLVHLETPWVIHQAEQMCREAIT